MWRWFSYKVGVAWTPASTRTVPHESNLTYTGLCQGPEKRPLPIQLLHAGPYLLLQQSLSNPD